MSGRSAGHDIKKANHRSLDPGRIGLVSRESALEERGDLSPKISLALSLRDGGIIPCLFDGDCPRTTLVVEAANSIRD